MIPASMSERAKQFLAKASKSRTFIGPEERRLIVLPTVIAVPLLLALFGAVIGLSIRLLIGIFRVLRK